MNIFHCVIWDKVDLKVYSVLQAKSESDVMFCYMVIRDLESIGHLCINPILRIGLIHN